MLFPNKIFGPSRQITSLKLIRTSFWSSLRCGGGISPSEIWRPTFRRYVVSSKSSA